MSKPEKSSTCTCYQIFYYKIIHASLLNTHDFKFDKEQWYINWKMYGMDIVKYTMFILFANSEGNHTHIHTCTN